MVRERGSLDHFWFVCIAVSPFWLTIRPATLRTPLLVCRDKTWPPAWIFSTFSLWTDDVRYCPVIDDTWFCYEETSEYSINAEIKENCLTSSRTVGEIRTVEAWMEVDRRQLSLIWIEQMEMSLNPILTLLAVTLLPQHWPVMLSWESQLWTENCDNRYKGLISCCLFQRLLSSSK